MEKTKGINAEEEMVGPQRRGRAKGKDEGRF